MATVKKNVKAVAVKADPKKVKVVEEAKKELKNIKAIDFVPVWQKSESAKEVGEHWGKDESWASAFASRLRKYGVKLKKMPRGGGGGGKRLDVDELNSLIDD